MVVFSSPRIRRGGTLNLRQDLLVEAVDEYSELYTMRPSSRRCRQMRRRREEERALSAAVLKEIKNTAVLDGDKEVCQNLFLAASAAVL
ncbi:MAG TPA: hypothetical protein VJ673_08845 [Aromatoleum sp.]|uniref:hypothetical protein n=1 Tax=Aromatoleum sp. TaxID=2307007 RepID=UPI002B491EB0|nr:hypothetical protein [Aromatoleum sp.]HJV25783.1 hypothetical protein [Aromatoleum sp.]